MIRNCAATCSSSTNLLKQAAAAIACWMAMCAPARAQAVAPQGATGSSLTAAPAAITPAINLSDTQNPFLGGVPAGKPTPGIFALTLRDALDRGLKYNLGLLLSGEGTERARGARLRALSELLPTINARTAQSVQQVNLAAFGIPRLPGTPPVVGPFGVFDARVAASESLDLKALNNYRAGNENLRAVHFSYRNARDLVVLVVGGSYMAALAGAARIESAQAQLQTSETLFRQAQDLKRAGVAPGIDVLRAQVQFQAQQQRLLVAENEFAKQKLALARAIGLPIAQEFSLADVIPYAPLPPLTLEQALERAYRERSDYQSAQALLRVAELSRKAAIGEALPGLQFNADYGLLGPTPGNSHGTFTTAAALRVPIFQGGKVRADVIQADALIRQRTAELEDLRARIEFEVRSSFLDVNAAGQQVVVARSSVDVARQQLTQAQDRFAAGVTNNIEVVQAQEAMATANENYISALFAHNLAKLSLARSLGIAEEASKQFLGGNR